jgi:hypothetical protein
MELDDATAKYDASRKLLLFIDILGFSDLCRLEDPNKIQATITKCLDTANAVESRTTKFKTIYFSDTVIFYQTSNKFTKKRFLELVEHSITIFNTLLAARIPISGAITFGKFKTPSKKDGRHPQYFGVPLVEGHESTEKEKWVGITVCPSVTRWLEESAITDGEIDGRWTVRVDNKEMVGRKKEKPKVTLALNPYLSIIRHFRNPAAVVDPKIDSVSSLGLAMKSLLFINQRATGFAVVGEFSTGPSVRYFASHHYARYVIDMARERNEYGQTFTQIMEKIWQWRMTIMVRKRERQNSRPPKGMAKRMWERGKAFIALEVGTFVPNDVTQYFVSSSERVPEQLHSPVPESDEKGVKKLIADTEKWAKEKGMTESL